MVPWVDKQCVVVVVLDHTHNLTKFILIFESVIHCNLRESCLIHHEETK